ncbi:hypothetical protein, partial [Paraburkholderia caledonica]|nr:hypothetical protein [Paraburkholderia caledonica]
HDSFVDTVTFVPRESMASPSSAVYTVGVGRLRTKEGDVMIMKRIFSLLLLAIVATMAGCASLKCIPMC